ncbi:DDE-type integrase/transposase/recombinase [Alcaligenaceae bacterium]|nr:DDE-type integrase/transposase/recombinase [Alcaligenaceae bacterium]
MLEKAQRERLLDLLDIPAAGRRLILDAVKNSPVRAVKSRGGNVLTYFQSRKMRRSIGTESRHLEFPAAIQHEYSDNVLEYFAQPCQLKFEVTDSDGEVHAIDHIPDFLVVTERGVWFEEWKPWAKLESRARRTPWRYVLDADDRWSSPLIEQWLAERGIGYRICTDHDIPQRRVENILYLEDYLDPDAPPCPLNVAAQISEALATEPMMSLAALYEQIPCRPEDALKLIADGELVADLDGAPLSEPMRCRVFRDKAVRSFELARLAPRPLALALAGTLNLTPNAQILYDQHPYIITFVGTNQIILKGEAGDAIEIDIQTVEQLLESGSLHMAQGPTTAQTASSLASRTPDEINTALSRQERLRTIHKPNRTERRLLQRVAKAKLNGSDELLALIPDFQGRGNRQPRLSEAQEAAMEQVISDEYLNARAITLKHCHRILEGFCKQQGIPTPSYPTLISRINALPQEDADRARYGKRVAYQNSEFVHVLYADTPVHGSRPLQYVHMDHTPLDIELISSRTGRPCGRPWLSIAIDAYTRRIVGIYLSFDPPSYRSNMMLLRDIVRRFKRLPQFIVVDNGADFRSHDFECFCAVMQIHVRFRPAGRPRHGAVMERIFGRLHSEYIHNLAGNTKALKNVRQSTGKFLPSRLAEWSLDILYYGVEYWAFIYYDQAEHSTLGLSPREAYERSIQHAGEREHRIVTLTQDFLVLTCPTVGRTGLRTVDRQRGIKVHANYFYWCPEFRDPKLDGKKVPVRYDPWNISTVYVQINGRWVAAQCKALVHLGSLTEKERELFSDELRIQYRLSAQQEPTVQQLTEFLCTFTPNSAKQQQLERQRENRNLYGQLGIGAVGVPAALAYPGEEPPMAANPTLASLSDAVSTANQPMLPDPSSINEHEYQDLPDLDTF